MSFALTKTLTIIAVVQMALRVPLTYLVDPVPFASFGVFWSGAFMMLALPLIGLAWDICSAVAWLVRTRLLRR